MADDNAANDAVIAYVDPTMSAYANVLGSPVGDAIMTFEGEIGESSGGGGGGGAAPAAATTPGVITASVAGGSSINIWLIVAAVVVAVLLFGNGKD